MGSGRGRGRAGDAGSRRDDPRQRHQRADRRRPGWRRCAGYWYSVSLKGVREFNVIMDLLKDGVRGEIAEEPFDSTTGGRMPAGSLIFPADDATAAMLDAAGAEAGLVRAQRRRRQPATTRVAEAPKVAVLRSTYSPPPYVPFGVMTRIFGTDNVGYVTTAGRAISLFERRDRPAARLRLHLERGRRLAYKRTRARAPERLLRPRRRLHG